MDCHVATLLAMTFFRDSLSALSARLTKLTVEAALNAEMDNHLGCARHEIKGRNGGNSYNGYTTKTLKGDHGEIELACHFNTMKRCADLRY